MVSEHVCRRIRVCRLSISFWKYCGPFGIKHLSNTVYHLRTNGQAEPFCTKDIASLQHYVGEHQKGYDIYVQQLTYPYNAQEHRATNLVPNCLVSLQHTPSLIAFDTLAALTTDAMQEIVYMTHAMRQNIIHDSLG